MDVLSAPGSCSTCGLLTRTEGDDRRQWGILKSFINRKKSCLWGALAIWLAIHMKNIRLKLVSLVSPSMRNARTICSRWRIRHGAGSRGRWCHCCLCRPWRPSRLVPMAVEDVVHPLHPSIRVNAHTEFWTKTSRWPVARPLKGEA